MSVYGFMAYLKGKSSLMQMSDRMRLLGRG